MFNIFNKQPQDQAPTPATSEDLAQLINHLEYQYTELRRMLTRIETKLCITAQELGVGDAISRNNPRK